MRLIQHGLIQHLARRRADELHLQVILVQHGHARVAEVVGVREGVVRLPVAHGAQALDIARAAGDDVHGRLGVLHAARVRDALVGRQEALRVVHVAEDGEVHAVFIK